MLLELNRCRGFFLYISDIKKSVTDIHGTKYCLNKKFNEEDYFEISNGNHVIPKNLSKLLKSFIEIESSED